jgi:hypothetical protein
MDVALKRYVPVSEESGPKTLCSRQLLACELRVVLKSMYKPPLAFLKFLDRGVSQLYDSCEYANSNCNRTSINQLPKVQNM